MKITLGTACRTTVVLATLAASTTLVEAMPIASPAASASPMVEAQYYYGYGNRPYYRGYRGFRYYRGRAGVYRCGPYALKTHLSRKYCR